MKILILGVNGFIGSNLSKRLVNKKVKIFGFDKSNFNIIGLKNNNNFHFIKGDIFKSEKIIYKLIKKCDVVVPLIAIATPNVYVKDPLKIFNLDFESNLEILKICSKFKKRVILPSTSEVYGKNKEKLFDEYTSDLVLGPINKHRWIYSCSKQLLDRYALALSEKNKIKLTIFRPFNWIGPNLDTLESAQVGNGRVLTIFINNIIKNKNIYLVNNGKQSRSFTYIDDGIDALEKIIFGNKNKLNRRIYNIGNPNNNLSIRNLAKKIIKIYNDISLNSYNKKIINVSEAKFYGKTYQDIKIRVPNIIRAKRELKWYPKTNLNDALFKTVSSYIVN